MYNCNFVTELVKHDLQDFSTSQNHRILTDVLHGLRTELRLRALKQVSYAYITPNDAFQCAYPADMARYSRLGVKWNGVLIQLSVNKDLVLQNKFDDCGIISLEEFNCISSAPNLADGRMWGSHYRNGQYVGEQYGVPGGFNRHGYFKMFDDQRIIQFDISVPKVEYMLEYISDGSGDNGQTILSIESVEPLRLYAHWQKYRFDPTKMAMAEAKKNEFYYAYRMAKAFIHTPTMQEWLDYSYAQYMSGPKR